MLDPRHRLYRHDVHCGGRCSGRRRHVFFALVLSLLGATACVFVDDFDKFENRGKGMVDGGAGGTADGGSEAGITVDGGTEVDCTGMTNGTACGSGYICLDDECRVSVCGDGILDAMRDEQCEESNDLSGDGCEPETCRYSCSASSECDDKKLCNGTELCLSEHKCLLGINAADETTCPRDEGDGKCRSGLCAPLTCGNGETDVGEQCDPTAAGTPEGCLADCSWGCAADLDCKVPTRLTAPPPTSCQNILTADSRRDSGAAGAGSQVRPPFCAGTRRAAFAGPWWASGEGRHGGGGVRELPGFGHERRDLVQLHAACEPG